jgi:signal transduction histidine kinase
VDLGASHALDEVRLVPARPTDWADQAGFGFPPRFRVSIADERGGPEVVLADHTAADFPNPRDNPVVIAAGGRRARMIRFVATRLAPRVQTGDAPAFVLALAELEAYAKGKNVAVGAAVEATDSIEGAPFPRWARRFLVDGAASTHVLMEQGPWLAGLDQRRQLERRLGVVSAAVTAATAEAASLSVGLGGLGVFLVGGAGAAALVWQRRARRRQLEALRRQVTSDLHDDVGSNLGTIALLSQVAQREATPAVAADLSDIERLARESAESLRDVVFLTCADPVDLAALTTRVQQLARVLLPGLTVTVGAPDAAAILPLPLEARRHLLLACKEALHNVAKHAAATAVHVRLAVEGATVRLTVEDDGAGFDVAVVRATGQGLPGLRRRAEAVGGTATIDSRPGAGTRIILTVPLEPRGGRSISSS